jgi:hypothetical protein
VSTEGPGPGQAVAPEVVPDVAPGVAPAAAGAGPIGAGLSASALAGDPRPGLDAGRVVALSARTGNAGLARMLAPAARLQREPQGAPPAQKHALDADDRGRLDNAKGLIDRAKANKDVALKALDAYSSQAPGSLTTLKTNADKNLEMHKAAAQKVNYVIGEAKEIAKIQDEVLMAIVGAALGGLGSGALEPISEHVSQMGERLTVGVGELKEFGIGALVEKSGAGAGAQSAAGMGTGDASGPTVDESGSEKELAFYKSFSALHANSTRLLAVAVECGKIGEPIGKVTEAIAGMRDAGVTRADYPVAKLDKDAATLESASRALAAAAPGVTQLLADLKDLATRATLVAPKTALEVEKDIWKAWASGLTPKDRDLLDLDGIEKYLKRIGIWGELGIDIGDWFSDDEEGLATASALAQQWILEHRGEAVEFTRRSYGVSTVRIDGVRGSPDLPATLDPGSTVTAWKVKAAIVGAKATGDIDSGVIAKAGATKQTMAEYLLTHGHITVLLRGYEDLTEGVAAPD